MGLLGILLGLGLLIWLAFRGWSVLLLAPGRGDPRGACWRASRCSPTGRKPSWAARPRFIMQFFPIFLLGALFGKLMEDSGSVSAIAEFHDRAARRHGGRCSRSCSPAPSSPMAASASSSLSSSSRRWRMRCSASARIPRRLMPAAIALGTSTFTMSALPGTPAIQNAIPMPFFGTTPVRRAGPWHHRLAHHAGLRPLVARPRRGRARAARARAMARGADFAVDAAEDELVRERATTAGRLRSGRDSPRPARRAGPPIAARFRCRSSSSSASISSMSLFILPRLDASYLADAGLGRDVALRRWRRLGGRHRARRAPSSI